MILKHSRIFSLIIILLSAQLTWAVDASYYSSLDGKKDAALREAITALIYQKHTTDVGYNWTFDDIDIVDGVVLDMYSTCSWTSAKQGVNYSGICDAYNREHSVPQNLFNEQFPQKSDRHHLFLTDGKVNGMRSSYPFGETNVTNGFSGVTNGSKALGKFGTASSGYSGNVYEPDDQYKGDFARAILYMAVRYATTNECRKYGGSTNAFPVTTWNENAMFSGSLSTNYGLSNTAVTFFLKWHRNDKVSNKEIARNTGVENVQGNRNPFVDYPILVEYLWGEKKGETFYLTNATGSFEEGFTPGESDGDGSSTAPRISVSTTEVDFGKKNIGGPYSQTFTITGANLSSNISINKSGTDPFTVTPTSIAGNLNSTHTITVRYTPTENGTHSATLTISSTGATSKTVTLSGKCTTVYTATWMADGTEYDATTAESNESPNMPALNPDDCSDERVFKGWTSNSSYSSNDGTGIFTTSAPEITENTTFYAVYADKAGDAGESVYAKVTSASDITDGQYLLVYEGGSVAMNGGLASLDVASNTISVSIDDSQIEITEATEAAEFTIAAKSGGYSIKSASNKYIGHTGSSNALKTSDNDDYTITLAISDGNLNATCNNYNLRYNSSSGQTRFRFFSSAQQSIQLYKKMSGNATYSNYSTQCSEGTKVTITFNANGGDGTMAAQQVPQSTSRTLNANTFTRSHYTFNGWNTQANGSGTPYADGASVNTSTDLTLYAQWTEASQYTVTFKNNGVTYATKTNYEGETITDVADPTACEGYTFEGWSTQTYAADNTSAATIDYTGTIPATNTTYHAVYSKTESSGGGASTDYELYSGVLTEGDYVLYYGANSSAMKNTVSSNRLTYDDSPTITNDVISNPDASIVWHIAASGDYWTIYNAAVSKYAGGTTTKNQGALLESVTDYALWTCSSTSSSETYDFENKGRAEGDSNTGNKYLRNNYSNNTNYGFACYANSTGGALSLYKNTGSSSTTYYTTSPNCCKATLTVQSPDDTMGTVSIE